MASFTTIARELRQEIYSYLLLPRNTYQEKKVAGGSILLFPEISTSLFTLNKQISNESLSYFYGQNEFVAVSALRQNEQLLMRMIAPCFLCDEEKQAACRDKVSLMVEFTYQSRSMPEPHTGALDLVCTVRDLPDYLRLLNAQHFCFGVSERQRTLGHFHFNLGVGYYNKGTADRLIKVLKEHLKVLLLRLPDDPPDIYSFDGTLEAERLANLKTQPFDRHSYWTSLDDCRCFLDKANHAINVGHFEVAQGFLHSIFWLMDMYRQGQVRDLLPIWESIEIELSVRLAVSYGRAGMDKLACISVASALDAEKTRLLGHTEPAQYAYLYFVLAGVLIDTKGCVPNLLAALELFRRSLCNIKEAEVRQIVDSELAGIEFKLGRMGVYKPQHLSIDQIIRQYPSEPLGS